MRYERPEVVVLSACAAIQSVTKKTSIPDLADEPSVTAYEADE